ncbi:3-dehydroquinate synthase II [Amycolatopsis pithecellobii]|uniref:3-dehydroquinate synthase II family protein n=1 Tax=Amycolatopsis pithecellobii TaxID=664692 RepID=A0A6N7Z396_9PSEU|nr:3-dehydroquinate synthase II [Amycolatopsis pithecellobii]MTD53346.1 3-dehydroquinate synthase II family protein [Amycolatopsis pithecellobii]
MKLSWIDLRGLAGELKDAIIEEAVHNRADAVLSDRAEDLTGLPPTIRKVLWRPDGGQDIATDAADVVLHHSGHPAELAQPGAGAEVGRFVEVTDPESLELACESAKLLPWTVVLFRDPTKIPLEIVLAAAAQSSGTIITAVADIAEAEVVFGVLEHGADGVLLAPATVGEVSGLLAAAASGTSTVDLVELEVTKVSHVGIGERACVDTCTHFREDEGILVGSHSKGMILCVSETHPLPYMPTRPFRVNAGAIHSYTLRDNGRTHYLSELRSGSKVLAVDTKGQARLVTVGRVKIETRPLIAIDAVGPGGVTVNLILQDDWHVRVLGPGATVLNSTELRPGDRVLGHLPSADRHVGYPIDEFCLEK